MSYIDTFDHELVGFFAGLPLYHPLEEVQGSPDREDEFSCTPAELVLGGGEGEHPAVVVRHAAGAVYHFIQVAVTLRDLAISAGEQRLLDQAPSIQRCLEFPGWNIETIAAFVARCSSPAFVSPYQREHASRDGTLEHWLVCSLGEFVNFAMPELAAEAIANLPETNKLVRTPVYYNVLALPPGYGAPAGRHKDAAGNVIWGNYPWITVRERQEMP